MICLLLRRRQRRTQTVLRKKVHPHATERTRAREGDSVRKYAGSADEWCRAEQLRDLLRGHRRAGKLTRGKLAERAGLSARGVQDLERGVRRSPHPETVRRLTDALGLGGAER
jgi:hypothetical protein